MHPRIVTVLLLLTYAFHTSARVSIPPLVGVGVATTVSPTFAPVTVTVLRSAHAAVATDAASKVAVAERYLRIVAPPPIIRLFADAVPLREVVIPDLPILIKEALVVPIYNGADPPASRASIFALFDRMINDPEFVGLMVEPKVMSAADNVKVRAVVPPAIVNPSDAVVKVSPFIAPKFAIEGEPEPVIFPDAVNAGRVSPVVATVPLIVGAVSVLFVKMSVVDFPTKVSVASGNVSVRAVVAAEVIVLKNEVFPANCKLPLELIANFVVPEVDAAKIS